MDLSTKHNGKFLTSEVELNTFREWFEAVQDLNPKYLRKFDYMLGHRLYLALGMRVPNSILQGEKNAPR